MEGIIEFECKKCKAFVKIGGNSQINNKRCEDCNVRICEECFWNTKCCLDCEIKYLTKKIESLYESLDYYKLELAKLKEEYIYEDDDTLEGARAYDSSDSD